MSIIEGRPDLSATPCDLMNRMVDAAGVQEALGPAIEHFWGLEMTGSQLLEGGMNSVTFTADLDKGRCVAKWVPQRDSEQLRLGAEAARLMDAAGVRSGAPLATFEGRLTVPVAGGELVLLEFVPGAQLTAASGDHADWGRCLGKVHTAGIRPAGSSFFDWVERDGENRHYALWVRKASTRIAEEMRSLPPLSWVQLHTDPEPGAFLRDDEGRVTALTEIPQFCSLKFPTPGRFRS